MRGPGFGATTTCLRDSLAAEPCREAGGVKPRPGGGLASAADTWRFRWQRTYRALRRGMVP